MSKSDLKFASQESPEERHKAYGDDFAACFSLKKPRSHITRSLQRTVLAATEIRSDLPTTKPTESLGYDEAFLIGVQLKNCPDHELWFDGRPAAVPPFGAGDTCFYDLRRDPVAFVRNSYHSLHFYLPLAKLNEVTANNGRPSIDDLRYDLGTGVDDAILHRLAQAILPAFDNTAQSNGLFLDEVLQTVCTYVAETYAPDPAARALTIGGLASWQERRVKEVMSENLGDDHSLQELADECRLSVTHFTRAFRQSTGTSPHRWLLERRVERAKSLLREHERPLSEIALECGFADQSHFTRVFAKNIGISPGRWRRQNQPRPKQIAKHTNGGTSAQGPLTGEETIKAGTVSKECQAREISPESKDNAHYRRPVTPVGREVASMTRHKIFKPQSRITEAKSISITDECDYRR